MRARLALTLSGGGLLGPRCPEMVEDSERCAGVFRCHQPFSGYIYRPQRVDNVPDRIQQDLEADLPNAVEAFLDDECRVRP